MQINRRTFLFSAAAAAGSLRGWSQVAGAPVDVRLHADDVLAEVPANFVGLSYEIEELRYPGFFSAVNTGLVKAFAEIAPHGVLRLGGNTSDVGWWKDAAYTEAPPANFNPNGRGEPGKDQMYSIDASGVHALRGFLDATGWTCLFGINLGMNTPERAAAEAVVVARELGPRLEYFQLGNEPDLFRTHLRDPKTWNADAYFDEWLRMAQAITAAVPTARFGLPDTAGAPAWYAVVARRLAEVPASQRPYVEALTHHYYVGGPPSNPKVTIERLLQPNARVGELAEGIRSAAADLSQAVGRRVRYRMSEGNTCFGGGKPDVSDVMASALWAAEYALRLASLGYAGLNLHGGTSQFVANSLGGKLPGDAIAKPQPPGEWEPRPYYTPIASHDGGYSIEPAGMGLVFAQQFAGGRLVRLEFDPGDVNATAYAAVMPNGSHRIALINKDASKPLSFRMPAGRHFRAKSLTAPALDSRQVSWSTRMEASPIVQHGTMRGVVAPGSALLIEGPAATV